MIIKTNIFELSPRRFKSNFLLKHYVDYFLGWDEVCIAGGALRTLFDKKDKIQDLDIFILAESNVSALAVYHDVCVHFLSDRGRFKRTFKCPENKLSTFQDNLTGLKLQIINDELNATPEEVLSKFDFNACRLAVWKGNLYWSKNTIRDIKSKVLSLNKLTYPVATLKRAYKYMTKGYNINEILKSILWEIKQPEYAWDESTMDRIYID